MLITMNCMRFLFLFQLNKIIQTGKTAKQSKPQVETSCPSELSVLCLSRGLDLGLPDLGQHHGEPS